MYLPPFPLGWKPSLPSLPIDPARLVQLRDNARLAMSLTLEVLVWAIAITFTAGRLARKVYEAMRPRLAVLCLNLAALLDPGHPVYPEQPEPPAPARARQPRARNRSRS